MPILQSLSQFLDEARIPYEVYTHALAFTAQDVAQRQHIPGRKMAKVVILNADGNLIMAVVPATRMVSTERVREGIGAKAVRVATESEFVALFPGCEIGAMPPFGNLFGIPVYVDPEVEKDTCIYFNAGNHVQTVKLRYDDFKAAVRPLVLPLTEKRPRKAA